MKTIAKGRAKSTKKKLEAALCLGADGGKRADGAKVTTAGINWYLNKYLKLMLDYVHSEFSGPLSGGADSEDGIMRRLQLAF